MYHSRAQFRAIRTRIGLSQRDLAQNISVSLETVKKWEKPGNFPPSEAAWNYLESMFALHVQAVQAAVDAAQEQEKKIGYKPKFIQLTLFRSQSEYNKFGRDTGNVHLANARTIESAAILEHEGYEVRFVYPEDPKRIYKASE